ncbi:hypothetical protein Gorai_016455 [Gossypium raimondii]|uniref:Uncharacterized protein n=1 Tax=Gossypium raimondii TaxID=29730 RepID=A0A7J8P931_GOSRA|nr:hypothetical protein [Gossypium raimondii]
MEQHPNVWLHVVLPLLLHLRLRPRRHHPPQLPLSHPPQAPGYSRHPLVLAPYENHHNPIPMVPLLPTGNPRFGSGVLLVLHLLSLPFPSPPPNILHHPPPPSVNRFKCWPFYYPLCYTQWCMGTDSGRRLGCRPPASRSW